MQWSMYFLLRNIVILCFIYTTTALNLTDTEFRTVLIGRCEEYQRVFLPDLITTKRNCSEAVDIFIEIFKTPGKPCNESSYEPFLSLLQHPVPKDKGMLWSGFGHEFIERISLRGARFNPISYTLAGYMLDQIMLCIDVLKGNAGCDVMCKDPTRVFWSIASLYYVRSISGKATIALSARIKDGNEFIYYNGSILAVVEIPNLPKEVNGVEVWPVEDLETEKTQQIKNKCGHPTTMILENKIKETKRKYGCTETSKIPMFAMCLEKPELCNMPTIVNGKKPLMDGKFFLILLFTTTCTFFRTYLTI